MVVLLPLLTCSALFSGLLMCMCWEKNVKNLQFAWQVSPNAKIFRVQTEGDFV